LDGLAKEARNQNKTFARRLAFQSKEKRQVAISLADKRRSETESDSLLTHETLSEDRVTL
jgi:hypothetical protein